MVYFEFWSKNDLSKVFVVQITDPPIKNGVKESKTKSKIFRRAGSRSPKN